MSSIIKSDNGVSSGVTGIVQIADSSGQLAFQTTNSAGTAVTALTLNNSQQATFANTINVPNTFGFKNRIINGAMVIDQRNNGASVTPTGIGSATYLVDRWASYASQSSKFSAQQNAGSVTPPTGFTNYLGITSLSSYSISSSDYFIVSQAIEGFNTADLAWGTSNAKTVTLSFQVYSSLTGTFGGVLTNNAQNRTYPFTYTISSANTWTSISITIAGDTTGTWLTNNSKGIWVILGLGCGSAQSSTAGAWGSTSALSATGATSVVGTNGATFYITGVQLEVGTQATSFDYRPFTTELQLCQRYFFTSGGAHEYAAFLDGGAGDYPSVAPLTWPSTMRTTPSIFSFTFGSVGYNNGSTYTTFTPSGGTSIYYGNGICGYVAQGGVSNSPGASQASKGCYWSGVSFSLQAEL